MSTELQTQAYLRSGKTLRDLHQRYEIHAKTVDELGLVVFNYRLLSPMESPIVQECRGLILEEGTWNVACKTINAFFEPQTKLGRRVLAEFDWSTAVAMEKLDGALVSFYYYKGAWRIGTRHSVDGEIGVWSLNGVPTAMTWRELVLKTIQDMGLTWKKFTSKLDPKRCYICELVGPENRVFVVYPDRMLYLTGVVDLTTLEELNPFDVDAPMPMAPSVPVTSDDDVWKLINDSPEPYYNEGKVVIDGNLRRLKYRNQHFVDSVRAYSVDSELDLLREIKAMDIGDITNTDSSSESSDPSGCLRGDVEVRTRDASVKRASGVRVGDVLSCDGDDEQIVTAVSVSVQPALKVSIGNSEIVVSESQRLVLRDDRLSLPARALRRGTRLDGGWAVAAVSDAGRETVYAITVRPAHRFAVRLKADNSWLTVHNKTGTETSSGSSGSGGTGSITEPTGQGEEGPAGEGFRGGGEPGLDGDMIALNKDVISPSAPYGEATGLSLRSVLNRVLVMAQYVADVYERFKDAGEEGVRARPEYAIWPMAYDRMFKGQSIMDIMDASAETEILEALRRFESPNRN